MDEVSNVRTPKYNLFFPFAGIMFVLSLLTYLLYVYGHFFSDFYTRYTYLSKDVWGLIAGVVPGLLFFLIMTILAFFLFSGKNKAYITVFSITATVMAFVWLIFILISIIPNLLLTLDYIFLYSDAIEVIISTLSIINMLLITLTMLIMILCFVTLFICHLVQKKNGAVTFIWIFPKILTILLTVIALLRVLFFNILLILNTLVYSQNVITGIDDLLYEYGLLFDNGSVLGNQFYIVSFILLGIGLFILSCGLNYHSTGSRPHIIVGTKDMND